MSCSFSSLQKWSAQCDLCLKTADCAVKLHSNLRQLAHPKNTKQKNVISYTEFHANPVINPTLEKSEDCSTPDKRNIKMNVRRQPGDRPRHWKKKLNKMTKKARSQPKKKPHLGPRQGGKPPHGKCINSEAGCRSPIYTLSDFLMKVWCNLETVALSSCLCRPGALTLVSSVSEAEEKKNVALETQRLFGAIKSLDCWLSY